MLSNVYLFVNIKESVKGCDDYDCVKDKKIMNERIKEKRI